MLSATFVSLLLAASAVIADVVDLTPDNFDSVVNGDKHVLVKFFAPWCGHCKAMAGDYITASNLFTKYADTVVIAEVDADAHNALGGRFGVSGYPTLKWFAKGSTEAEDYSAGRGLDDIVAFVNQKAGTKAVVAKPHTNIAVLTPSNFETYMKKDTGMLLEFYAPWCGHCKQLAPIYEEVATTFVNEPTITVANCDADAHRKLGEPFGVSGFPTIKWISSDCHGADCAEDYDGAREGEAIVNWINGRMGTARVFGGRLNDSAGRSAELDEIVPRFMAASDKSAVVTEATQLANDEDAEFYVRVMSKMVKLAEGGNAWLVKEVDRLAGLLDMPVAAKKKDQMNKRLNVIRQFHNEL